MNPDVNTVILSGRLATTPQIRDTTTTKVCNFRLKTEEVAREKTHTAYHNCVAWAGMTRMFQERKEGDRVSLRGRLATRSYVNKEGLKTWITEVVVQEVIPHDRASKLVAASSSYRPTQQELPTPGPVGDGGGDDGDLPF